MNDVASDPGTLPPEPVRERGWWRVVLATLLFLFVTVTPVVRIILPIDQPLVLILPSIAACAVAGWWAGGRIASALSCIAVAALVLVMYTNESGTYAYLAVGWTVLLAATFAGLVILSPTEESEEGATRKPFSSQAFAAIALTLVLAAGATLATKQGATTVKQMVSAEAAKRGEQSLAEWRQTTGSKTWTDAIAGKPDAKTIMAGMEEQIQAAPEVATSLFPSMLALESLVALAIGWAVYHRFGRERLGPPLAALRDFRFSDQFVWGLVVGLALVVVPGMGTLSVLGANLLVFFGALYALRGVGVALWFLSPGRVLMGFLIVFALVYGQLLGVLAVGLGVGDTWLKLARPRQAENLTIEVTMEVILRQAVDKLGHPGDIVKVSAGYARNFLLPRGVAYEATAGNKKRIAQEKDRLEAAESARVASAQEFAAKLEAVSLTFSARVGEEGKLFGSVTPADIAEQLKAQGLDVEKRMIDLHEPIRALGVYKVPIKLHADVKPEIKVWVIKA